MISFDKTENLSGYVTEAEATTISGDIVAQITSSGGSLPAAGLDGSLLVVENGEWVVTDSGTARLNVLSISGNGLPLLLGHTSQFEGGPSYKGMKIYASDEEEGDAAVSLFSDYTSIDMSVWTDNGDGESSAELVITGVNSWLTIEGDDQDLSKSGIEFSDSSVLHSAEEIILRKLHSGMLEPQGLLWSMPAYMDTTISGAQNIGTGDAIAVQFTPVTDILLSSVSFLLDLIENPNTFTLTLHDDNNDEPDSTVLATGGSGYINSSGWVRLSIGVLLKKRHKYWLKLVCTTNNANILIGAGNFEDSSLSIYGGLTKFTEDGGSTWASCNIDVDPAYMNIVINSSVNHNPLLFYGAFTGKYLPVYVYDSALDTSYWTLVDISIGSPLYLNCDTLTKGTIYNVTVSGGVLGAYDSTLGIDTLNGVEIEPGSNYSLIIGRMQAVEGQPGYQMAANVLQGRSHEWVVRGKESFNGDSGVEIDHNLGSIDHEVVITFSGYPGAGYSTWWVTKGADTDTIYCNSGITADFYYNIYWVPRGYVVKYEEPMA